MPHPHQPPISLKNNVFLTVLVSTDTMYNFCDLLEFINLEGKLKISKRNLRVRRIYLRICILGNKIHT